MTEKKEKIGVAVRVPEWVLDEIEEAIRQKPRPRPTRGELLEAAWLRFKDTGVEGEVQPIEEEVLNSGNPGGERDYNDNPSTASEMLTALISTGRKTEVDAILRLIRAMFEAGTTGKGERKGKALIKTGNVDFDRAATAILGDAKKLRDGESDIPTERRRHPKRSA